MLAIKKDRTNACFVGSGTTKKYEKDSSLYILYYFKNVNFSHRTSL